MTDMWIQFDILRILFHKQRRINNEESKIEVIEFMNSINYELVNPSLLV